MLERGFYESFLRPILFSMDSENAHELSHALGRFGSCLGLKALLKSLLGELEFLPTEKLGYHFTNPLGNAAGFDKEARILPLLEALGFGFTEAGGVVPKAQPGNPRPRIFRLPEDRSIINRLGFPSEGISSVLPRIENCGRKKPLLLNVSKNKDTALEDAWRDYAQVVSAFLGCVDLFVINVSSPNTPRLRELQTKAWLLEIFSALTEISDLESSRLLIKVSPDLEDAALDEVLELVTELGLGGLVAVNTTRSREGVSSLNKSEEGGLSGPSLFPRAIEVVKRSREALGEEQLVVGVGGVSSGADMLQLMAAGADLVQIYTALVYRGPFACQKIISEARSLLKKMGLSESEFRAQKELVLGGIDAVPV